MSQKRFHDLKTRFKGFSGPVGSGKSAALCQEAIKLCYVNPGRLGLIGGPTYPMLKATTERAFLDTLLSNKIPFEHRKTDNLLILKESGARIVFRAVNEYERLRGANLAWFGIDELTYTPEAAWTRLEARLRDPKASALCGFAVWTPKGEDWVYRRFIASPPEGYGTVLAKPNENRHILERIPDYYQRLKASYDERFYRQEVLGEYLSTETGNVYASFSRTANVRRLKRNETAELLWTLDFNVDPMCSVIAQRYEDMLHVLDEISIERAGTAQACEEFLTRYPNHAGGLTIYGDASAHRRQTAGSSDHQIIRQYMQRSPYRGAALLIPRMNPLVRDRVALVNSLLCNAEGRTRLLVDERCKALIRDLESVKYKAGTSIINKDSDGTLSHLSDALGYLTWAEFGPKDRVGERARRIL